MIVREGDCLRVTAAMVMTNAKALQAALASQLDGRADQIRLTVDLAGVERADSSALAVMLAWLRQAQTAGQTLRFINLPAGVRALADLYGIDALLPQA